VMHLALLLTLLALSPASLDARRPEDLVLIDGRYLHVKVLSENERGIKVQLLDTGGEIFVPWGLIDEPYRTEIMKRFGRGPEENRVYLEEGERVNAKSGDFWEGKVTSDTAENVVLKHRGSSMTIPKASVRDIEKVQVNVLEIYTPDEYYNKIAGEVKAPEDDIPENMRLGELAGDLGLYDKAFAHYKRVQATDPGYEKERIENILKRLEEFSKNKQIRDALEEAKRNIMYHQFEKAMLQLEALIALQGIPDSIKGEVQIWKERCVKLRYEYYRRLVREHYEKTLYSKIATLSRDEKVKLQDAQRALRSQMHKDVVTEVATRLKLDPKEVEKMWEERNFGTTRIASYGSGSFIVLGRAPDADKYEAELNKYLQQSLQKQNQRNQGGSLSAQPDKLPKPPTKEEWWTKVSTSSDREQWMRAYWAEQSKKVTVVGDRWEDCSRCGGTGALKFSGTQGDILRTTCPACQGHKRFKGVAFK
jgi:hypothetical protein